MFLINNLKVKSIIKFKPFKQLQIAFLARNFNIDNNKKMSIFVQNFNPIAGKTEWTIEDDNYDYHQEIARSAYADMLHDTERNQMYYSAIKKAVDTIHKRGEMARVLDIGTGTGLLSMMAASCGAELVTACEAFVPMGNCAKEIIKRNGFAEIITVIPKRSTELFVGPGCDMEVRANILVTEVFDTELIGEGALTTFSHAHEHLLEKCCIVVPTSAVIYAQIVQSDTALRWNQPQPIELGETKLVNFPSYISNCSGAAAVHDIQLTELPRDEFQIITKPSAVFTFDFSGKEPILFKKHTVTDIPVEESGKCQAIFMWWDLQMDLDAEIILSCAPIWAHPTPNNMQWRDHWMQAIYYPEKCINVKKNEIINLNAYHDMYSLWFSFKPVQDKNEVDVPPACTCRYHVLNSRTRVGMLNDQTRNDKYINILKKIISKNTTCLCISDGSLLPIMAAKLGAKHVYSLETDSSFSKISSQLIRENHVEDRVTLIDSFDEKHFNSDKVDVVLGEPFFSTSLLPWDNLYFLHSWKSINLNLLANNFKILPSNLTIYGIGVEFKDLSKIRYPVFEIEGFDVTPFNKLIEDYYSYDHYFVLQQSTVISDSTVEPHPLWEYPSVALTEPFQISAINLTKMELDGKIHEIGNVDLHRFERCNGVALWADFKFDDDIKITTGPICKTEIGQKIIWDKYCRQGVYFMKSNALQQKAHSSRCLHYDFQLFIGEGEAKFVFNIV
ncbi:Protein arginine N-methyltransferase 7 [Nymphon striatum]|nr:Protein arginine N-methyltransferase 7 [Nymphon striatum]